MGGGVAVGEHFKEAQTRMGFSSRTKDTFSLHDGRRAALGVCGNQSTVFDVETRRDWSRCCLHLYSWTCRLGCNKWCYERLNSVNMHKWTGAPRERERERSVHDGLSVWISRVPLNLSLFSVLKYSKWKEVHSTTGGMLVANYIP